MRVKTVRRDAVFRTFAAFAHLPKDVLGDVSQHFEPWLLMRCLWGDISINPDKQLCDISSCCFVLSASALGELCSVLPAKPLSYHQKSTFMKVIRGPPHSLARMGWENLPPPSSCLKGSGKNVKTSQLVSSFEIGICSTALSPAQITSRNRQVFIPSSTVASVKAQPSINPTPPAT